MTLRDSAARIHSVDAAIASPRAAMLTNAQYVEVMRLRKDFERACEADDAGEADRLETLEAMLQE